MSADEPTAGLPITEQPSPIAPPKVQSESRSRFQPRRYFNKFTSREGWLGDYDYAWLCTPTLPFGKKARKPPPFYALDQELPLLLALTCGLQHALAMLAGLITPPIIFSSALNLEPAMQAYLISASLIGCGELCSIWSRFVLYQRDA